MKLRNALLFLNMFILLMGVSMLTVTGAIAQSQPVPSSKRAKKSFVYNPPTPPPGQGTPVGRREGGASRRGSCQPYRGLTALMPETDGRVEGWATTDEPTLWVYMPVALSPETKVELVLQDKDDEYVIKRRRLRLKTDSAGIVPVKLKRPITALEVGETYQWTLSIYCDPERKAASVYVQGLLSRVSDDAFQGAQMPSFELAAQYAEQGIWFESLTLLAQLRQAEPDDFAIAQAWYDLLQQVELGSIAPAKLLFPGDMGELSKLR